MLSLAGCSDRSREEQAHDGNMVARIESLSLSEPGKALAVLDSAERAGAVEPYDLNFLRCLVYHNGYSDYRKALRYGRAAYEMPDGPRDAATRLRLIDLLADDYLNNGDHNSSVRLCTDGLKLAQDSLVKDMEANLHTTMGLNLLEMGNEEDAFRHLRRAVGILASLSGEAGTADNADDYVYAIGMTVNSLVDKGRYAEAALLMDEYMAAVDRLERYPETIEGIVDNRRASGYAVLAYIFSKTGEPEKAEKYYRLYLATDYSSDPEGETIRIPYLLASHRPEEALHYIEREKKLWQENADTISHDYVNLHLAHEREAYENLGDFRKANSVAHTIETISDSLRTRERTAEALELAEIYKTNEQALRLDHQANSIKLRNIAIIFSLIVLVLALAFILRILRQKRAICRKNESMSERIDELMAFKEKLLASQAENIRLRDTVGNLPEEKPETTASLSDRDRDLWERMNQEIIGRKLYLNRTCLKTGLSTNTVSRSINSPVFSRNSPDAPFPNTSRTAASTMPSC